MTWRIVGTLWRPEKPAALAALGVFGTGTGWPDILVAATMATLALQGASTVLRRSLGELRQRRPTVVPTIAPHIRS